MKVLFTMLALTVALSGCMTSNSDWTSDQQAVFDAMQEFVEYVRKEDTASMWDALSPDGQEIYRRELEFPGGARSTWKSIKEALDNPESRLPDAQRSKLEADLENLPDDPTKMTPKGYYSWKISKTLTSEGIANTARLWERLNISSIEVDGTTAIVELKSGDEKRISWSRHDGVWKFDGKPSTMRELKDAREREKRN
ncbi:MAG: hypothetical protein ACYTDT_09465 [Planctomycetota bacterium]|jgi:hypothetical protein